MAIVSVQNLHKSIQSSAAKIAALQKAAKEATAAGYKEKIQSKQGG